MAGTVCIFDFITTTLCVMLLIAMLLVYSFFYFRVVCKMPPLHLVPTIYLIFFITFTLNFYLDSNHLKDNFTVYYLLDWNLLLNILQLYIT